MAWTLAGVTIHPDADTPVREVLMARQNVLDATDDTLSYFGARSITRTLQFTLLPETSGSGAKTTLDTAVITDSNVALVSDQGAEGNYRILSFRADRLLDVSRSYPVWKCTAELVKTT